MGGSIGEHVCRQSYKMSTSQVTFSANLIKRQLLMSTSTVILARILQSVNFSIYRYILGNTNTGVCSDIGNTNTSIHPVSYCPIWDEAVLIPDLSYEKIHVNKIPLNLLRKYQDDMSKKRSATQAGLQPGGRKKAVARVIPNEGHRASETAPRAEPKKGERASKTAARERMTDINYDEQSDEGEVVADGV